MYDKKEDFGMKCMKTRLSLVLAMVLVILSCLGCWSALAEDVDHVTVLVTHNGETMEYGGEYLVSAGDVITVDAEPLEGSEIAFISYFFADPETCEGLTKYNYTVPCDYAEIIMPAYEAGTELILWVEPVDILDDGEPSEITKTGWQGYYLVWGESTTTHSVDATRDSSTEAHSPDAVPNGNTEAHSPDAVPNGSTEAHSKDRVLNNARPNVEAHSNDK